MGLCANSVYLVVLLSSLPWHFFRAGLAVPSCSSSSSWTTVLESVPWLYSCMSCCYLILRALPVCDGLLYSGIAVTSFSVWLSQSPVPSVAPFSHLFCYQHPLTLVCGRTAMGVCQDKRWVAEHRGEYTHTFRFERPGSLLASFISLLRPLSRPPSTLPFPARTCTLRTLGRRCWRNGR